MTWTTEQSRKLLQEFTAWTDSHPELIALGMVRTNRSLSIRERAQMKWVTNIWDRAMCYASEYGLSDRNLLELIVACCLVVFVLIFWRC